jgi:hypothetical protein
VKRKSTDGSLTISVHGGGIDLEATIKDANQLVELVQRVMPSAPPSPHDFDVVLDVIQHGDLQVLRSIEVLVKAEIERRSDAS